MLKSLILKTDIPLTIHRLSETPRGSVLICLVCATQFPLIQNLGACRCWRLRRKEALEDHKALFTVSKVSCTTGQIANLPQPMVEQMIQCFVETGQLSLCYPGGQALQIMACLLIQRAHLICSFKFFEKKCHNEPFCPCRRAFQKHFKEVYYLQVSCKDFWVRIQVVNII